MSDEKPSPGELAGFLRSFSSDQFPDDGRQMCAAADFIDDAATLLREVAACEPHDIMPVLPFELQDRVRALIAKHGRG